jgi:hypothetical protein
MGGVTINKERGITYNLGDLRLYGNWTRIVTAVLGVLRLQITIYG